MKAADIMTIAKSFVGTKEIPSGSNNVVFNTDYYGHAVRDGKPNKGDTYPWCCVFVWDVFRIAGASSLFYDGKKTAYCPAVQTWAKKNGLIVDKTKGQYGDLVLFDWNANGLADHIGFVLDNKGNGNYTTIEGNTSITSNDNGGKVMERNRKSKDILAIIRPKYDTTPATKPVEPAKTTTPTAPKAGQAVNLRNAKLYASTSTSIPSKRITGTYYLYDGKLLGNRYRITNKASNAGKKPTALFVTGWIDKNEVNK